MEKLLYKNLQLITGPASIPLIENAAIIVDGQGSILYAGPYKQLSQSDKNIMPSYDLKGAYVMPGLINAHGHYFNNGKPVNNFPAPLVKFVTWFLKTWLGKAYLHYSYPNNYKTALSAGITTVRDVGSLFNNDLKCRKRFAKIPFTGPSKKMGRTVGPRIVACGSMITTTGGHGYEFPDRLVADGPWPLRKAVREQIIHQVDWVKICNTAGVSDARSVGEAGQPTMTVVEIQAACDEAHSRGFMVASHCESSEGIRRALAGGVDTIEHGAHISEDMAALFLDNPKTLRGYTSLVPTLSTFLIPGFADKLKPTPANKILIENTALIGQGCIEGLQSALKHGIPVGIGNDSGIPRVTHYNLYQELFNFQKYSKLTNAELIQIATMDTANLIGVDGITGTLEVGKSADFMVLDTNPLEDLNNLYKPKHVAIKGHLILAPKFKTFKGM